MRIRRSRRLVIGSAAAAVLASIYGPSAYAQTFDTTATVSGNPTQIEQGGNFTGTQRRVSAEGLAGGTTFAGYAVLDFSATSFSGGNLVSGINKFIVNLWDNGLNVTPVGSPRPDTFAFAGPIDFYLSTITGSTTSWRPDTNSTSYTINGSTTAGIDLIGNGGNSNTGSAPTLGQLYSLGTLNYVPQPASSTTVGSFSLDFTSTLGNSVGTNGTEASFIASQINNGGKVRLIIAPQYGGSGTALTGTAADFAGSQPQTGQFAPQVELGGSITAAPTNNAVLNAVVGGTASKTLTLPNIPRLWRFGNATSAVTLTVGGDGTNGVRYVPGGDTTRYSLTGATPAPSGTSAAVFSILAGGGTVGPGTTNYTVNATLHNLDNPNDTTDVAIQQTALVLVDTRTVGMQPAGNTFVNNGGFLTVNLNGAFHGVLSGATVSTSINIGTSNPANINPGSNTLTLVRLAGTQTATLASTAAKGTATVSAGIHDVVYGSGTDQDLSAVQSGTELSTRTITLRAGTVGGSYVDVNTNLGFGSITLSNADDPLAVNPASRGNFNSDGIDYAANVYQPALVTPSSSNVTPLISRLTLTNAAPFSNKVSGQEIGLRAAAVVTSVSAPTAQAGFTVSNDIGAGSTLTAGTPASGTNPAVLFAGVATGTATFDPTFKLNGVYNGSIAYGLQHADQNIAGTALNDLGSKTINFSATVSGNSGSGYANILPGGSFAGYYINRGSGANTTVTYLGGSSSANTNIMVNFSTSGSLRSSGDAAALTGTSADKYVVQFSFGSAAAGLNPRALALSYFNGTHYVNATLGNSDGGASSLAVVGPYDGSLALGHYGVDPVNNTVWAVVDHPGTFMAYKRAAGDTRFRGLVDFTDLNQIVSRGHYLDGTTTNTWSDGDFTGDGKVDFNDINAIVSDGFFNTGPYDNTAPSPSASPGAVTLTGHHGASPSSTTVGVAGDGNPDFRYDASTGDVTFIRDGFDATKKIRTLTLLSAGSKFITGVGLASQNLSGFDIDQTNQQSIARFGGNGITTATLDLGDILPIGLTTPQLTSDLTVYFNYDGSNAADPNGVPADIVVPEPTVMSLLGLGAAGLLARRRRRQR
jgi:hypothetical protein